MVLIPGFKSSIYFQNFMTTNILRNFFIWMSTTYGLWKNIGISLLKKLIIKFRLILLYSQVTLYGWIEGLIYKIDNQLVRLFKDTEYYKTIIMPE